ncbi:MAG: cache domain-containing protein, partial [Verrucomicrobiota bacterium]
MKRLREILSGSFRMKVLVPVIGVMVLLLVVTAWVVNRRITSQFEVEATRALSAARQGFRDWQQNRARTLSLRFGDLSNEPRYRAAFQTRDTLTVRAQLGELLKSVDQDVRIVLFTTQEEESLASVSRDPLLSTDAFEAACGPVVRMALQGDQKVETLQVGGRLYDVVCLPVLAPGGARMGALSIGVEMGDAAAAELSRFTRSQVVLLSEGQVMLTTFGGEETRGRLPALYRDLTAARAGGRHHVWREFLEGRHYFCAGGRLESVQGDGPIGYLLLYSYEDAWNSLVRTQQWLLAANGLAILFGSIVVSFFVGKVTAPLRVLRDGAEVVGRGDFSHRVRVRSTDECGRLAQEFNRMTENLERSRRELETAHAELVETSR